MSGKAKKSVESLTHFICAKCRKWWTIGDAPPEKDSWFCPWCGTENKYENKATNKNEKNEK
jgi:rRNA maturation endonuclease Nob1